MNYLSEENLNTLVNELKNKYLHTELLERYILNYAYPIGTVYESINNVSYEIFLGGTWETFSAGTGADASGEEKTVYRWVRTV